MSKDENFKKVTESIDETIATIRKDLGKDAAAKVSQHLIHVQEQVKSATEVHDATFEENQALSERNTELLNVNNDLYVKAADQIKGTSNNEQATQRREINSDPLGSYVANKMQE